MIRFGMIRFGIIQNFGTIHSTVVRFEAVRSAFLAALSTSDQAFSRFTRLRGRIKFFLRFNSQFRLDLTHRLKLRVVTNFPSREFRILV